MIQAKPENKILATETAQNSLFRYAKKTDFDTKVKELIMFEMWNSRKNLPVLRQK